MTESDGVSIKFGSCGPERVIDHCCESGRDLPFSELLTMATKISKVILTKFGLQYAQFLYDIGNLVVCNALEENVNRRIPSSSAS